MVKKTKVFEIAKNIFAVLGILFSLVILAGIYKFNFTNDDIFVETESGEVVPYDEYNKRMEEEKDVEYYKEEYHQKKRIHQSWDVDGNGINDCELDGSCDHTVNYSKPRNIINK